MRVELVRDRPLSLNFCGCMKKWGKKLAKCVNMIKMMLLLGFGRCMRKKKEDKFMVERLEGDQKRRVEEKKTESLTSPQIPTCACGRLFE